MSQKMTRIYPHYYQDDGTWEFNANEWKDDTKSCELPTALVKEYKETQKRLTELSAQIKDLVPFY